MFFKPTIPTLAGSMLSNLLNPNPSEPHIPNISSEILKNEFPPLNPCNLSSVRSTLSSYQPQQTDNSLPFMQNSNCNSFSSTYNLSSAFQPRVSNPYGLNLPTNFPSQPTSSLLPLSSSSLPQQEEATVSNTHQRDFSSVAIELGTDYLAGKAIETFSGAPAAPVMAVSRLAQAVQPHAEKALYEALDDLKNNPNPSYIDYDHVDGLGDAYAITRLAALPAQAVDYAKDTLKDAYHRMTGPKE
jgi:hypothetical protein